MDSQTNATPPVSHYHIIDPDGDLIQWFSVKNIWIEQIRRWLRKPTFTVHLEMHGAKWKYKRKNLVEAEKVRQSLIAAWRKIEAPRNELPVV